MSINMNKIELIRALTPLWFSAIGGAIAIAALCAPNVSNERFNLVMGLGSAAITGAARIAQSVSKNGSGDSG